MKLRDKLLLAEAPLLVALLVVGAMALFTAELLSANSNAILKDNHRSILATQKMGAALARVDLVLLEQQLGAGVDTGAALRVQLDRFDQELRIQEGNITETGEGPATQALREAFTRFRATALLLASQSPGPAWVETYRRSLEPEAESMRTALELLLALNQDALVRKSTSAQRVGEDLRLALLWTILLSVFLGVVASVRLTRRILGPLQDLMQAARSLGEKDFHARAPVVGRDEISLLAAEFNTMADRLNTFQRSTLGELLQAQQSAQAVMDSFPDPVLVFDSEGRLSNVNAATSATFQFSSTATNVVAMLPPAIRDAVEKLRDHTLSGQGAYAPRGFEEAIRCENHGVESFLLPRAEPVHDDAKRVVGAALFLQDVTRLRRFDQLKTDLVATVAHEFRTPLTSLHMAIHLCLDGTAGDLSETQQDLLHAARADCERLQAMVNDLLDLSRAEGGVLSIRPDAEDVSALLENAGATHSAEASLRRVHLVIETVPAGLSVLADVDRMALVFSNLISNAIRHSPEGGTVSVGAVPQENAVRFEVRDAGPGIDPAFHQRVFEKFFRVPGQESGGAGIGLYIARDVVQAHGGTIGVDSTQERGSTFWFTLPRAPAPQNG